ncbi:MAG: M20/M25/M40 family metallo-hydrolase [Candidatus Merdivicinus sp.]
MNSIPALFSSIETHAPKFQAFLERLTAQESFTFEPETVTRAADLTAAFAETLGFSVERKRFPKAGDGLVISQGTSAGSLPPICFVAHLDTVHPSGSFPDSLKPGPEGGIYGPGIVDCKGGAAIALLAMFALGEAGCPRPLRLILVPDEEASNRLTGPEGIAFLQEHARGCAAALVCECGKRDEAVVERKGITKVRVDIRGRAAHAGMYYAQGISAIREAACQILALEQQSQPDAITYNCGRISGGTAENVVPETCSYTADIRYRNAGEEQQAMEHLRRVTGQAHVPGAVSTLTVLSARSPMPRSDAGMTLFEHLRATGLRWELEDLRPMENGGGSDAAYTAAIGVPTVCAVGMTGWDWHSIRERTEPDALTRRAKLLAAAIAEYPGS